MSNCLIFHFKRGDPFPTILKLTTEENDTWIMINSTGQSGDSMLVIRCLHDKIKKTILEYREGSWSIIRWAMFSVESFVLLEGA